MKTNSPSSPRLERRKQATRQKIVSVSLDLFRQQGFDSTPMEQIAEATDIAKGTLYNYFPVKEAILDEFIRRSFVDRNEERLVRLRKLPGTRTRMAHLLNELIQGIHSQREIFEKYFAYRIQKMISLHPDESAQSGLYLLEKELLQLGQEQGELRTDLPLDLLTGLFEFSFIKVAQAYYQNPDPSRLARVIEQSVDLFMRGAAA
jgi:AcrR family transcriptional regulator